VRLLKEGAIVTLQLAGPGGRTESLAAPRMRYLDGNGALARMFEVGELTQSLCSPWTHDFRDCGCYYWATNHPDIALPARTGATGVDETDLATVWLRADRNANPPPVATEAGGAPELRHHGINRDWQLLNFVFESREQLAPYAESEFTAAPFADLSTLLTQMRYAAGVELALTQEYLVAAWSLRPAAAAAPALRPDLRAAFSEVMRIAIGEMRHLRAVNEVLRAISPPGGFLPALQVAAEIPLGAGVFRARASRALTPEVIAEFIDVEAPSTSVDSLYSRILATLVAQNAPDEVIQAVRTIMAEGEDHWQTFKFIQEWLGRHSPAAYLRATAPAAPSLPAQAQLQARYAAVLDLLHQGYAAGLPGGAAQVNTARNAMLDAGGIEGALEAVAAAGFLPVFAPLTDPRFGDIARPPDAP
ncbi:MAG TPA: ferritin-like domain-containing protein, partial [Allosphingosinicella sp.]|nr:ferritin-like domain-containing protein [Allosphingosinicella sp.]